MTNPLVERYIPVFDIGTRTIVNKIVEDDSNRVDAGSSQPGNGQEVVVLRYDRHKAVITKVNDIPILPTFPSILQDTLQVTAVDSIDLVHGGRDMIERRCQILCWDDECHVVFGISIRPPHPLQNIDR